MENRQLICDHCGKVLYGKEGTAYVSKNYITIVSRIGYERFDKETMKYDFIYLLPSNTREFIFCVNDVIKDGRIVGQDFNCMEAFFEHRIGTMSGMSRQFDKVGEVKKTAVPDPLPAVEPDYVPPAKKRGRPKKETTLVSLERPKNLPPFDLI